MKSRIIYAVVAAMATGVQAEETSLPTIEVEAEQVVDANTADITVDSLLQPTPSDGGEWILEVPGVSGISMGTHGIDPVIRGQKYNQLNVLLGGAYLFGGCPNRMDPPSSYATPEIYDSALVIKGMQSLIYGAGGPGGTVLYERATPDFKPDEKFYGKAGAGYETNGAIWNAYVDAAAGSNKAFLRGTISAAEQTENYTDGNGDEVFSGYKTNAGNLLLGMRTDSGALVRFDYDAVRGSDIKFAGARMDAPLSDSDSYKLIFESGKLGSFSSIKADVYRTDVYHEMDNFSLRTPPPSMWMWVPSDSVTDGARLLGDMMLANGTLTLGLDYQANDRDATRYTSGTAATFPTITQSILWPGVSIEQPGIFGEYTGNYSKGSDYTVGLRVDYVDSSASKADESPTAMGTLSPNELYTKYYGTTAKERSDTNVSALYRMEHVLDAQTTFRWGLSRTVRSADATEQFIAANGMVMMGMCQMCWVGNPDIEPEAHHQLDLGLSFQLRKGVLSFTTYYDDVSDYILLDRAHGQEGINTSDWAFIYRNVDAILYGFDLDADYRWTQHWRSHFTAAYVYANNKTDDRPIGQTPAPQGTASLEYWQERWMLGGGMRAAARQSRVDDDPATGSGVDFGVTPGYTVYRLYGLYRLAKMVELKYGIDNLFDKYYRENLNKPSGFDPTSSTPVYEPGRSYWARVEAKF
jgi:iron complex outermembrane receptor protein